MQALSAISIPLTNPQPITIQLDGQQRAGITPAKLRLENESPYLLTVALGGDTHHLAAWTADVFVVPPGVTQCGVLPTLLTGQTNPPSSLLLPSIAGPGEDFPGAYPVALNRQTAAYLEQDVIKTISGPANTTQGPTTVPVPAGTQSIGYLVRSDAGNDTPLQVTIQGTQSRNDYGAAVPQNNVGGPQWFLFARSDTSVDVTLKTNLANPSAIDVIASPLVQVLDVVQTFGTDLSAQLVDAGRSTPIDIDNPAVGQSELGVSMFHATPASWQVANQNGRVATGSIAAGASVTMIAGGGANVRTRLRKVEFEVVAAAGSVIEVECPAGTGRCPVNAAVAQRVNLDWDYLDCGLNAAVAFHNTGGSASGAVNGHATANQT